MSWTIPTNRPAHVCVQQECKLVSVSGRIGEIIAYGWLYTIKFLAQVSCGKYCASFYTASFFFFLTSCRKKCLRFLSKKLADVFTRCSSINISATLHTYRIDFVTTGLGQGWQTCGPRVVGKKFFCFNDNQVIYNKKVISPPEKIIMSSEHQTS